MAAASNEPSQCPAALVSTAVSIWSALRCPAHGPGVYPFSRLLLGRPTAANRFPASLSSSRTAAASR